MTVAAMILAAGLSSRLPENKLLQNLRGKPVIRHVAEAVLASPARPVIVVTGNDAARVSEALDLLEVRIIENVDYSGGLSTSLKCGLRNVPPACEGVLVALGDMPFVTATLIGSLLDCFGPGHEICVPVRHGQRGNPVLWSRRFFPEIMTLQGDRGAKHLMDLHADVLYELEAGDDGALIDIDTPDDLKTHGP